MKKLSAAAVTVLILFSCSGIFARPHGTTGVGIILGEPTGISFKKWTGAASAIDIGLAWSFSENNSLHLHIDYLVHNFDILADDAGGKRIPVYFGLGGRLKLSEEDGKGRNSEDELIGIRIPIGCAYNLRSAPIEFFLELVPVLDIIPETDFDINAAIGARFYF